MEEAKIYAKIWKTGQNTDVITIKKEIVRLLDLKKGDTIEATIKRIKRAPNTETTLKKFNRRE